MTTNDEEDKSNEVTEEDLEKFIKGEDRPVEGEKIIANFDGEVSGTLTIRDGVLVGHLEGKFDLPEKSEGKEKPEFDDTI
jgi:hypothetical protein